LYFAKTFQLSAFMPNYQFFLVNSRTARVFALLSGAPDYGDGQLDTRRYGEQYASKGEDTDAALLPEQIPFYRDLVSLC
jgi:hypothetical protein